MSLQLIDVSLDVLTTARPLQYRTRFGPGLNVLAAPNSYGKSTLMQSIIFALGLEGMLTASNAVQLGPVMTTVADLPGGERPAVVESAVTLTCTNGQGGYLRTRRFASGKIRDGLVQTWEATSEAGLDSAERVDTFVRTGGAAVRELGFHRRLAEFIGWTLPQVPTYRGPEVPLYLETLFPLFYVEQKTGWAGITPRMPTYLGIRDMLRRSVEFVLGLSTLERLRAIAALKEELNEVKASWLAALDRMESAAFAENLRLISPPRAVTGKTQRAATQLEANVDGDWKPLAEAVSGWTAALGAMDLERVATAGERTEESKQELERAERQVRQYGSQLRLFGEQITYVEADLDALSARLASVEADRRRLQDLQRVRQLGSDIGVAVLSDDLCPTCLQPLDDRHVVTGQAASIEETLTLGDAERTTLIDMRGAADQRLADLMRGRDAVAGMLDHARGQVRFLRDELVSESAAPSLVQVRQQLWLADRVEGAHRVEGLAASVDEELDDLAERHDDLRSRLKVLEDEQMSPQDRWLLSEFNRFFVQQLTLFGLRSLPAAQVSINPDSLIPTDDGMELRFDITAGMSASDTIRTKWAYYLSLMRVSGSSSTGHHARLLMLDEPRQQETAPESVAEFVRQLGVAASEGNQILYATSEAMAELDSFLGGIPHVRLATPAGHLLAPAQS